MKYDINVLYLLRHVIFNTTEKFCIFYKKMSRSTQSLNSYDHVHEDRTRKFNENLHN